MTNTCPLTDGCALIELHRRGACPARRVRVAGEGLHAGLVDGRRFGPHGRRFDGVHASGRERLGRDDSARLRRRGRGIWLLGVRRRRRRIDGYRVDGYRVGCDVIDGWAGGDRIGGRDYGTFGSACGRGCRGSRVGSDRDGRLRRRRRRRPYREEAEGIPVAVGVGRISDAELDVGGRMVGRSARAGLAHHCTLVDHLPLRHQKLTEVRKGDREPTGRQDRDRFTPCRHKPGEGDLTGRGRPDRVSLGGGDVDAAVLTRSVRIRPDREAPQHGSVDWPRPGETRLRHRETHERQPEYENTTHSPPPVLATGNARRTE